MSLHLLGLRMLLLVSVLATAAGAGAPPSSAQRQAPQASIEQILAGLRKEGQGTTADQLQKVIAGHQEQQKKRNRGYLMVGRIRLEGGPARLNQLNSQVTVVDGGWFVTLVEDLYRPIPLRLHGYEALDVSLKGVTPGAPDAISYIGEVALRPLPAEQLGTVRGRLVLADSDAKPHASAYITMGSVNTPGNGGGGYRPASLVQLHVEPDGRFELWGMTPAPARYEFSFRAAGHVAQSQQVSVKRGETQDLGELRLEKPRHLRVRYILSETPPPFRDLKIQQAQVAGGALFKADPKMGGYTFFYRQDPGEERLRFFHRPCELAQVGKGPLEKFRGVEPSTVQFHSPYEAQFEPGAVYLLNHHAFKHWVLFQVEYADSPAK